MANKPKHADVTFLTDGSRFEVDAGGGLDGKIDKNRHARANCPQCQIVQWLALPPDPCPLNGQNDCGPVRRNCSEMKGS